MAACLICILLMKFAGILVSLFEVPVNISVHLCTELFHAVVFANVT